ncbi:hypothetical protein FOXYS1_1247 [Fusarium oxysporum]|uniref:Nucleoside 2-deoxyribosyltransferase n=1 Tax=Fusarium oxysporum TaxID=5507 RepID=A0A8H5EPN2_FUSOX|nr:hypothetical protein FOXYS1_1247 [Fusarium oxysporum]
MEQHAKIVMAPRRPDSDDKNTSIFLAGITTSTGEPDWRETLTKALMDQHVTILNPNRPDWDSTWKEDFSDKRWEEQVWWELDMQEAADIIVFFFHPSTEAPISLMELGLAAKTKPERSIVCALDGYRKKGNVEAVCKRFGANLVHTETDLRDTLLTAIKSDLPLHLIMAGPTSGQGGVIYGAGCFSAPGHLLSLDELEERREYAKQLESYMKRGFRSIIDPTPAQSSPQITKSSAIPGSSVSECESDNGFPWNWDMPMFGTNLKLNDHVRDLVEEAKCLERDGNSCVVLDTVDPMFRWMPRTKKCLGQEIDISGTGHGSDSRQLIDELNLFHDQGNPTPVSCEGALRHLTRSGKPLPSGYLIHINMQTDETKRFKEAIDIQWTCILFAAFSGAAGNPELPSRQNPDDKAMQWIQSQAR